MRAAARTLSRLPTQRCLLLLRRGAPAPPVGKLFATAQRGRTAARTLNERMLSTRRARPPRGRQQRNGGRSAAIKANKGLVNAKSADELLQVHAEHGGSFDTVNIATLWSRLGRMRPAERAAALAQRGPQLEAVRVQTIASLKTETWGAQALANLAHAHGKLTYRGDEWSELMDVLAQVALPQLRNFKPQALSNTAWAFAVADAPSGMLFSESEFVKLCTTAAFSDKDLRQLHQWELWVEERGEEWPRLPSPHAARCRAAFCAKKGVSSKLQTQVATELAGLGLKLSEEVRTPQGYSLDAVVVVEGRDVAVEVDGPSHFVGRTGTPSGSTMLKRRQLRAAGWPLLSVPYWEWNAFGKGNAAAKRAYLEQGLGEVLSTTSATTAATNHQRAGDHAPIAVKANAGTDDKKMQMKMEELQMQARTRRQRVLANAGTDNKKMQLFKDLVRELQK